MRSRHHQPEVAADPIRLERGTLLMSGEIRKAAMLPAQLQRKIDGVCDQFEAAWRSGGRPKLEEYLTVEIPIASETVRYELLRIDIEYRLKRNDPPCVEEYIARLPADASTIRSTFRDRGQSQSTTDQIGPARRSELTITSPFPATQPVHAS